MTDILESSSATDLLLYRWLQAKRSVQSSNAALGARPQTEVIQLPEELEPLVNEMLELRKLPRNWNSYGGHPPTWIAIAAVAKLFQDVAWSGPIPRVVPMGSGGIHLEWGNDDESVEIEASADGHLSALIEAGSQFAEGAIEDLNDPLLADVLTWASKLG